MQKHKSAVRVIALCIPLLAVGACGNSNVASEDYVGGYQVGQLLHIGVYGTSIFNDPNVSGKDVCQQVIDSGEYPNITAALSSKDSLAGCAAGYDAEVGSDAPVVGDPLP